MRPSDVASALQALIPTRRPLYLWGPPGVGKSSLIRQAARALDLPVVDIRAVLLDPVDLRGLPRISADGGSALWCPPAFLPRGGEGVLFLDELAQAPPLVQAACLQLTLDRRVGEYELPDGWSVVAASNRAEDRAGAHRLISPLLNRFVHLDLEVSNDDWQEWAVMGGVAPEVRGYLRFQPGMLFQFEPSLNARAFPTPRSWSFVSDVLPSTPGDLLHPVVAGCVGEGAAAQFCAFCRRYRELPDLDEVLRTPSTSAVPKQPDVLHALVLGLAERCRRDDPKLRQAYVAYCQRLPEEFGVLALRDGLAVTQNKLTLAPGASEWLRALRKKGVFEK